MTLSLVFTQVTSVTALNFPVWNKQLIGRGGVLFKNWVISYVFWWSTIFEKEKVYEAEKEKEGGIDDSILKAEKLQLFTGVSNRGSLVGFLV